MAGKTAQKRSRLLFYGLIRLRLRNSGLRPSDSLDAAGSFRLIKSRKRSQCFAAVLSRHYLFRFSLFQPETGILSFTFFSFPVFAYSNC